MTCNAYVYMQIFQRKCLYCFPYQVIHYNHSLFVVEHKVGTINYVVAVPDCRKK